MENTPTESDISGNWMGPTDGMMGSAMPQHTNTHPPSDLEASGTRQGGLGQGTSSAVRKRQVVEPYSSLGQFSYAPATQTTVVTTTTTTTTSFPPLLMKPPRQLAERDPKLYPLAASPTPQSLKTVHFDIEGRSTCYREADNPHQVWKEYVERQASLQSSNGLLQSIERSQSSHEPSSRTTKLKPLSQPIVQEPNIPHSNRLKRASSPTPPSIAEAAELALADGAEPAKSQRKHKKLRPTLNSIPKSRGISGRLRGSGDGIFSSGTLPTTPDTEVGSSSQFKTPRPAPYWPASQAKPDTRQALSSAKNKPSLNAQKQSKWDSSVVRNVNGDSPRPFRAATNPNVFNTIAESAPAARFRASPTVIDGPGVSATPPIVESDLEPVQSFGDNASAESLPSVARLSTLDTLSANDASLPSPSLSPITLAATMGNSLSTSTTTIGDDDSNDVESLDLSHDAAGSKDLAEHRADKDEHFSGQASSSNTVGRSPTPSFMDIPTMIDSFDALPDGLKSYVMYQFLRRCAKETLHMVADVVNPALKCDFLGLLPLELSLNIVNYLDFRSMCNAAQVSKQWRDIINTNEKGWKELLDQDGYVLPEGELERSIQEGWGWQYPHSTDCFERDLRETVTSKSEKSDTDTSSPTHSLISAWTEPLSQTGPSSNSSRPKRKATIKYASSSSKRQKRKATTSKSQPTAWLTALEKAHGPHAYASAAQLAMPYANVGLPSLRSMHLYKSLYARHHLIQKSWMTKETRPHHITFRAHTRHVVTCLQFDTDKILTGSDDTNINVYDTKTGALRTRLEGHEGGVWALQYEGNILVSGSTDRSVRVWNITTGKCTQTFQGHTSTVRCLVILKPTKIGEKSDGTPIIMPQEPLIITGSRDSTLRVWKLPEPNDRPIHQTGPPANDYDNPYFIRALTGHQHSVRAIAAHGDTLVSGSYDSTVRVWKISTGEVLHRLTGHTAKVYSVVLDHARNRCISGSMDYLVKVWSLETGQCLFTLEGHTSLVGLLDLCNDRLVSAAADSTLRIWDPENGQCKATLSAHTGAITCFQHDGQKVISGSDRTLKMWNVKTGECVKDLLTDLSGVWQVKFNDRRCVAAVQRNNMTYIEVLDFGATRDGVPADQRGRRILVDSRGREIDELDSRGREIDELDQGMDSINEEGIAAID